MPTPRPVIADVRAYVHKNGVPRNHQVLILAGTGYGFVFIVRASSKSRSPYLLRLHTVHTTMILRHVWRRPEAKQRERAL